MVSSTITRKSYLLERIRRRLRSGERESGFEGNLVKSARTGTLWGFVLVLFPGVSLAHRWKSLSYGPRSGNQDPIEGIGVGEVYIVLRDCDAPYTL